MGVVIVQSKATAHVYRIFGALVVLLLLMALAVGLIRLRGDQPGGSPYGSLASVAQPAAEKTVAPPAANADAATPAPVPAPSAPVPEPVAAAPIAAPPAPAAPMAAVATPDVPTPDAAMPAVPTPAVAPAAAPALPPDAMAMTDPAKGPRMIALDKAAADSLIPQPAPPAVVEAATRAATAPSPPAVASNEPVDQTTRVVSTDPQTGAASASNAGRVNINSASVDQLNHLGAGRIGSAIARHRPYRSIADLVSRRVLKARDLARIQGSISAY